MQKEPFGEKNCVIFELQKAVQNGNVDKFVDVLEKVSSECKLVLSVIFDQVTPANDSLLHEAAYFGKAKIAELIGHHFPQLLTKTNIDGDTPLHVAARSKSSGVIKVILSQYDDEIITRLNNEYGNTALHEAVYSNYLEGVTLLFDADKCVAHYLNKSGISPLHLAVLTSKKAIVDVLLEAPFPDDKLLPKCHGISPLHAAISTKNADLLKKMVEKKSYLMYLRDERGGTPIHYAASIGYVEGVRILLKKSTLAALEYNTKGHLPIHLASKWGHLKVVKEFCEQEWADPRGLLNKKGQNILHVAAQRGRLNVVGYLLRNTKFKQLNVNKKDKNGNTPLHLAARPLHFWTVFFLTQDKRIDVNLMNNEGFTARDIVLVKEEIRMKSLQELINLVLKSAGSKQCDKAKRMLRRGEPVDKMKDKMNTLMVVAILIVTVTFAAGFTVPGGIYSSDDPNLHNRGMAVLGHKTLFKIFVVFDTVAMYTSTFGSFFLLWVQLGKFPISRAFSLAHFLASIALLSMTVAFMAAVSLVVNHVSWLASFTFDIGIISFCAMLAWSNVTFTFSYFFIMPMYCVERLKLILGFLKPSYEHDSLGSVQARAEEE